MSIVDKTKAVCRIVTTTGALHSYDDDPTHAATRCVEANDEAERLGIVARYHVEQVTP